MNGAFAAVALGIMLFRLIVLGTCAYVVFWLGFSGWWFLLAVLLCSSGGTASTDA